MRCKKWTHEAQFCSYMLKTGKINYFVLMCIHKNPPTKNIIDNPNSESMNTCEMSQQC